jgi:hypothetical protein
MSPRTSQPNTAVSFPQPVRLSEAITQQLPAEDQDTAFVMQSSFCNVGWLNCTPIELLIEAAEHIPELYKAGQAGNFTVVATFGLGSIVVSMEETWRSACLTAAGLIAVYDNLQSVHIHSVHYGIDESYLIPQFHVNL